MITVFEIAHKLPRKKKKKLFGTRKNPRIFYGIDLARNGGDVTIERHIENGKTIENW